MAYINLLPWREEQRQRQQNAYVAVLGSVAAVTFVASYLVFAGIGTVIDSQRHRNDFLQQEIRQLDRQIAEIKTLKEKRDALAQRIYLIADLQKNRNMVTRIFNDLASSVPGGVYLTEVDRKGGEIRVVGKSESNNHLSNLMRRIDTSSWLSEPSLQSIEADDQEKKLSKFLMRLFIRGETESLATATAPATGPKGGKKGAAR
ncbi:MAG: PilN domain-containing protein [Gammaproteobacteria bacterium]|nr:PilN domain-containing protein [Gammaproteobacteria bacterium]